MSTDTTPDPLQRALQSLPLHRAPPADGWQRLQAALPARQSPGVTTPAHLPVHSTRRRRRRRWPLPLAAGVAAALGVVMVLPVLRPAPPTPPRVASMQSQVQHLEQDYGQAVATLPDAVDGRWQPALDEIDRSAAQIRAALHQDPGSRSLFEQLQRTYALRLELTRQAASAAADLPFARRPS